MRVRELLWPQDRIDHIARHNVRPDEVEEVFYGSIDVGETNGT